MVIKQDKTMLLIILICTLALSLCSCNNSANDIANSTQVIARVNGKELTTAYFERRLALLSPLVRKGLQSKEGQQKFVESLTARELLLQAAEKAGLDKDYTVITKIEDYKKDVLIQAFLKKEMVNNQPIISKEEIQEYYDLHKDNFKEQPEFRISNIFLQTEVEAKEVLERLKKGEGFAKLAMGKSVSRKTAVRGGDMGYLRKWQLPDSIAEQVCTLEPEQISEIIPSDFGYTILKVTDKRMGEEMPLEMVSEAIKNKLLKDKQRMILTELVEELKKKSEIVVNESVLVSLTF